ncbi:MAG: HAMP domain-containing sensor histidine kinase [Gemmatimonadaceae bacterium]
MRRTAPLWAVIFGVAVLLTWYVFYMRSVVTDLRVEASRVGKMYARVYDALSDPDPDAATTALQDLSALIRESGVPVIVTDARGTVTASQNLPPEIHGHAALIARYARELARENKPVVEPGVGTVYFGNTRLVEGLRIVPALQALLIAMFIAAGIYALRTRGRADREQIWAGMARESAHQLGTPLSSMSGWIELLRDHEPGDPVLTHALEHMDGDLERLRRVAFRFERIGRPPRREKVDVGDIVDHVATYFRARVPTLAKAVTIRSVRRGGSLVVDGDPVLLEWAIESLAKNAIDALAGRGGRVTLSAQELPEGRVRIRVKDNGPGVPRELRKRIFDAGFSTKEKGWGIGLSLARRIVTEGHNGRLLLQSGTRGATFDIIIDHESTA